MERKTKKQVILLVTIQSSNYWESPQKAPYLRRSYKELPQWEELSKNCPLPGLGIYSKQREGRDFTKYPFVYLKITDIEYASDEGRLYFFTKPIKKSTTKSEDLIDKLPAENKTPGNVIKLFSAIEAAQLINILNEIGEKPPKDWINLIESVEPTISWRDYIGKYFLEIESENISNNEFEDRVAQLLIALGFKVTQKGYRLKGEYPDGVAEFEDYGIVYDCKNIFNYIPNAADKRALQKYYNDERRMRDKKHLYKAFIAKSFKERQRDIFYFPTDALLYLLYKKLIMGPKFSLSPFKKILSNNMNITIEIIEKEWI